MKKHTLDDIKNYLLDGSMPAYVTDLDQRNAFCGYAKQFRLDGEKLWFELRYCGQVTYKAVLTDDNAKRSVFDDVHVKHGHHLNCKTTRKEISKYFYWLTLREDVNRFMRQCEGCCFGGKNLVSRKQNKQQNNENKSNPLKRRKQANKNAVGSGSASSREQRKPFSCLPSSKRHCVGLEVQVEPDQDTARSNFQLPNQLLRNENRQCSSIQETIETGFNAERSDGDVCLSIDRPWYVKNEELDNRKVCEENLNNGHVDERSISVYTDALDSTSNPQARQDDVVPSVASRVQESIEKHLKSSEWNSDVHQLIVSRCVMPVVGKCTKVYEKILNEKSIEINRLRKEVSHLMEELQRNSDVIVSILSEKCC